jgi:hypothetical protein
LFRTNMSESRVFGVHWEGRIIIGLNPSLIADRQPAWGQTPRATYERAFVQNAAPHGINP